MEKYWVLDLKFIKAKGRTTCYAGPTILHPKHKKFRIYKVDNYIKSKVIGKNFDCDIYERSGRPFEYLEMKRRFIIPSEVTITREYFLRHFCCNGTLLEETKIKSVIKYVVDKRNMYLKPSKIIYYNHDSRQPFISSYNNCFDYMLNARTIIIYDESRDKYKYYNVNDDETDDYDLEGNEARREIEKYLMSYTYEVKPVENVEHEIVCNV